MLGPGSLRPRRINADQGDVQTDRYQEDAGSKKAEDALRLGRELRNPDGAEALSATPGTETENQPDGEQKQAEGLRHTERPEEALRHDHSQAVPPAASNGDVFTCET